MWRRGESSEKLRQVRPTYTNRQQRRGAGQPSVAVTSLYDLGNSCPWTDDGPMLTHCHRRVNTNHFKPLQASGPQGMLIRQRTSKLQRNRIRKRLRVGVACACPLPDTSSLQKLTR